ncbi:glycosyltransferase family 2 protein [Streptococcus mitis]|uniref:Glycosyltransferase n=1 Tax=Streptococcus mitis TaxID=28037 RepID=A0A7X1RIM9_STRMT|nr:glycosyltransferase family 2 protein [Streptococcus mitis]MQQ31288.1 glycosyltransferase [Streptococcus mitis]MQQ49868.1 glycosyltransferase [Streptococcus mitis]
MISVIVPVYNVEEYLKECLNSIQHQTYTDIEVILVNDGSRDGSKEICERYCQQDSRFHLINQENKGLSGARNRGMTESKGELITFVDSDDVLKEDMLEQLIKQVTSDDIDIVECWYTNDQEELAIPSPENVKIIFQGNAQEALVSLCKDNIVRLNAVAKLFRRQVIVNFPFLEGLFYEDVYGGMGILKQIHKMVKIDYIGYYYRVRSGSIMNREFSLKNLDLFTICDKVEQLYEGNADSLPYVQRRLFHLVLMHLVDYRIFEGNPYQEKYVEYLNRYAKSSSRSFLMRAYRLFPQKIVFISRVVGAIQWRFEKYIVKRFWRGLK